MSADVMCPRCVDLLGPCRLCGYNERVPTAVAIEYSLLCEEKVFLPGTTYQERAQAINRIRVAHGLPASAVGFDTQPLMYDEYRKTAE